MLSCHQTSNWGPRIMKMSDSSSWLLFSFSLTFLTISAITKLVQSPLIEPESFLKILTASPCFFSILAH